MKELSIEEKAKAYDIALDKIKMLLGTGSNCSREDLEYVFHELAESEDERIRKELLAWLKSKDGQTLPIDRYNAAIAWLEKQGKSNPYSGVSFEYNGNIWGMCARDNGVDILCDKHLIGHLDKQGEQKPADKVEPKFKIGDFIANDYCFGKVIALTDDAYLLDTGQGIPFSCEHNAHLWTIQDAKDGDVLSYENEIFIVKKSVNLNIIYYCCYDRKHFIIDSIYSLAIDDIDNIRPATKEQRDLLFQKMEEAGYEWNAEKKELKKKEVVYNLHNYLYGEQKPAWSEDDERILNTVIHNLRYPGVNYYKKPIEEEVKWLKSFKDRYTWKPSDEQMKLLREVQQALLGKDCHNRFVNFMYELKRLREE